jgi:hypothetical protein
VVTLLILLCAVLIGPTKAVSGKVGKHVQDLLASVMGDDAPPAAEQPHLDGIDVSNGPQFDINSVLNFQNAGESGPAIQGDGGQGTTPGSNGNGSQSNNNNASSSSNGGAGSFGPRGFAPGHFSGSGRVGDGVGGGGGGGGIGNSAGAGPAALKSDETSDQNDQGEDQNDQGDQGGKPSSGPQGASNPSNPGGPGNSDGSEAPPSLPGNGGSDGPSAGGPNGPTGGNGPFTPTGPDDVTGPDSSNPGLDNPPAPHTNTLRQTEETLDAVPEPSSLLLLAFGVYAHAARRRRTGNK